MKFSIIIPSLNQGKYISQTIDSILNQNHNDTEIIVVDGGSTDSTVEILRSYGSVIKWISEKDEGQSDALNKGFNISTGEIIGWINSDDYYLPNVLGEVNNLFENENAFWVIGRLFHLKNEKLEKVNYDPASVNYNNLLKFLSVTQPSAFYRRDVIEEVGAWDKSLYMIMDYDLWIRIAKKYSPKIIDKEIAVFRFHDEQKTSARNLIKQIEEFKYVFNKENISFLAGKYYLRQKYYYMFKNYLINHS